MDPNPRWYTFRQLGLNANEQMNGSGHDNGAGTQIADKVSTTVKCLLVGDGVGIVLQGVPSSSRLNIHANIINTTPSFESTPKECILFS